MDDVFQFRDKLIKEYERFSRSFVQIAAPDIRNKVEEEYANGRYWPEPLVQINPHYQRSGTIRELVDSGTLHPGCLGIFQTGKAEAPRYPPLAVHAPESRPTHCPATQKLRRHHRHRIGQVAFVLHSHHRPHPQGAGIGQYGAHPGHRHLPDECPGQQPA